MASLFNWIFKASIYLLVFLLPLFFLPFSFEAFEFNKQYLLFFLVSLAFFAWLGKMVIYDKEIRFRRTPLDIPVLIFLFVATLSAMFSVDRTSSLFGFYGRFSDGLIGLLSLGVLYFLITNNVSLPLEEADLNAKKKLKSGLISGSGLIKMLTWSVFLVILFSYFSLFGIWTKLNSLLGAKISLPQVMLQRTFNPVSGSMEGLAVFLSIIVVLLLGLILCLRCHLKQIDKSKFKGFPYWILLLASLFLLIIVDFRAAWIVLFLTLVLFLGFALVKRLFREKINKLLLSVFLIIIAAIFIILSPLKNARVGPVQFALPQEQILDQGNSWEISLRAVTENVKSGFLGSGIGTFHYDFAKFKSPEFNQTRLWSIRFDRAGSYVVEIIGTMGFLGILSYLALIGFFLMISWFFLERPLLSTFPLLMTFLAIFICQFFYYQNTTLAFLFWLILGLSVVSWQKPIKEKVYSFKDFPELSLVFTALLIIIGLVIIGCYFFSGKFYLADLNYARAQGIALGLARTGLLEKATDLNSHQTQYQIILARAYLNEALTEIAKPATERDSVLIQNRLAKAIEQAKRATEVSPNRVISWETLGMIYRDIQPVATGALEWGIKAFEKAIELEPTNPVLQTELGKLYLAAGQIQKAKQSFAKAKELKPDYIDALIQEALIYEREENIGEAIKKLEGLVIEFPFNIEIMFQLGRLYFNNNQLDEAISQLERVTDLVPNHSNALYSLGVAYKEKGEIEKAIASFEKVLELNPGNSDVIQKLEELKR